MNIFELILSEPQSYQPSDYAGQVGSWSHFRANINALFANKTDPEIILARGRDLWASVRKNSVELLPVMVDYYLSNSTCMQTSWKRRSMVPSRLPSRPLSLVAEAMDSSS